MRSRATKVRSGLAMLGITCAVATLICVVAIGEAGTSSALAALGNLGDNLVWIAPIAVLRIE